jgi:hypothetical protein
MATQSMTDSGEVGGGFLQGKRPGFEPADGWSAALAAANQRGWLIEPHYRTPTGRRSAIPRFMPQRHPVEPAILFIHFALADAFSERPKLTDSG